MDGNIRSKKTRRIIIALFLCLMIGLMLFLFGCNTASDSVKCGKYYLAGSDSAYIEIKEDKIISFQNIDLSEFIEGLNDFFDENIDLDEATEYLAQDNEYHYSSEDKILFLTIAEFYGVVLKYDGENILVFEGDTFILNK